MKFLRKDIKSFLIILLSGLVLTFLSRWKLFLTPGVIGHNWDWSITFLKEQNFQALFNSSFVWKESSFGYLTALGLFQFPLLLLGSLFGGDIGSKLFFFLIPFLSFINMTIFLRFIGKKILERLDKYSIFLGTTIYALSPIVFNNLIGGQTNALVCYAFFPLFFYYFFNYFEKEHSLKYLFGLGIIFFLFCSSQILFLTIGVSILFFFILYRNKLKKFILFFTVILLISNSIFVYLFSNRSLVNEILPDQLKNNILISQSLTNHLQTIDKVFTGAGYSDRNLFLNFLGNYRFVYLSIFYLILILVIYTLFVKPEKFRNKRLLFAFVIVYLIGLFLVTGGRSPFGELFIFLMTNFTIMKMFRSFFIFFVLVAFPFSVMATVAFSSINKKFKGMSIIASIFFLIAILPVFIEGDNGIKVLKELKKDSIDIYQINPNFLDILKEQFRDPLWYRVLYIPNEVSPFFKKTSYQRSGQGGDPEFGFSPKPILDNFALTPEKTKIFDLIEENSINSEPINQKLLGFLSFNKIVRRRDVSPGFSKLASRYNDETIDKKLGELENISRSEYIDYHKLNSKYYLPHFYIPKNIIYSNGDIESLADIVSFGDYQIRSGVYLENSKQEDSEILNRTDEIFVKGERENAIKEEEFGVSYPEVFFPYVRQKPGSLFYYLALKKEEYDKWKVRKEPEKLFEKHLFYASKRVSEIMAFGVNERVLANYKKEMTDALGILKKLKQEESKNFVKLLAKYEGALWEQRNKINELTNYSLTDWDNAFQELEGQAEELKIKQDFSKIAYKIEIPKEGDYEIFIKNINGLTNSKINGLNINGLTDYSLLYERNFEEGKQELVLPFSGISENLVDENLRIKNYSPNFIYRINFDYKAPQGGSFFVAEGKAGETAETKLSSTGDEFRNFEMFFKSSLDAQEAVVHLSISVSEEKNLRVERIYQPEIILRSINEINGLTDYKKTVPKITFVKINPTKYRVKIEGAVDPYTLVFSESFHQGWKLYINELTDSKINELKNYGEIVASYFNGDIKEGTYKNIFLDKNTFETWDKKAIPEERHLLVNGYANSWYITPEDSGGKQDYELMIEFAPQRLFYVGLFISLATLIACIGFIFKSRIKNL